MNYQLKVLRNGTIEPISNDSFINYVREDGSNGTSAFATETIYVSDNSSDPLDPNSKKLHLTITDPLNASHGSTPYNITTQGQLVKWKVNYTGNYSYKQTVIVDSDVIEPDYVGNGTAADLKNGLHYDGYTFSLTPGTHMVEVYTTEYISGLPTEQASDSIQLYIITNNGQITLE